MVSGNLCFRGDFGWVFQLRNVRALPGLIELPTVIRALDGVALYAATAERSTSVNTYVAGCVRGSSAVAPNNQWFAEQPYRQR